MEKLALRDEAEEILLATARDMGARQALAQQSSKSKGHGAAGGVESNRVDQASSVHGVGRESAVSISSSASSVCFVTSGSTLHTA